MTIYNADGTLLLNVEVDDSSYFYAEVMNREDITLDFSLAEYTDIPTGSYIVWENKAYWLLRPAEVTVVNRRNFGYKATFETDMGKLSLWRIRNTADGHVKFPLTARPSQHLQLFIDNLNDHEGSQIWQIAPGSFDDKEITLSYNQTTIRDAIGQLADACDTEWEVYRSGNNIYLSLGKVEYNADSPLSLSYGEDNGFESGVKRTNEGGGLPIEVLYVQGGDRNIDSSHYFENSTTLLLPRGQNTSTYSFSFDGEYFNGESGYEQDGRVGVAMVTDAHGHSVRLQSAPRGAAEETLDLSDIYPKRVGTISGVETEPEQPELGEIPFYNIIDDSLGTASGKEDVDYNQCWIDGEQMTIIFQSGMLVGREISVAKNGFTLEANQGKFKLCQETIDGFIMPGESPFIPAVGDTYAVFGCMLPEGYLRSYSTHSGAEFDLLRKAAKYLYENCKAKQTFKGTLSKVFARKNWTTIGSKIVLGGYVNFTDEDVQDTPVSMRIMSVKRYINNPYKPEIELSNEATKGTVGSSIQTLTNNQARTERGFYDAKGYTNRRFRDAEESISMLEEAMIEGFGDSISPITVKTMGALVGDNTLQYEFTNSTYSTIVDNTPYFNNSGGLVCGAGYIKHFTLGFSEDDYVKSNRPANEYYRWTITAATFTFSDTSAKYLYIVATKPSSKSTPGTATYLISPTGIPFEPTTAGDNYDTSHYYMLLGTVSSEVEGARSIATYNGFTEVTPGQIRAMKFISNDGYQYIDFINKAFKVGDASKWIGYNLDSSGAYDGRGVLRLKGTMTQSPSGDTFPTPCFRGEYITTPATTYFYGDLVTYNGESWLHTGTDATTGTIPAEGNVWTKYAAKGVDGTAIYNLDLTNENASVNADKNGDILPGAILPTCTARLYYGSEQVTGVTYAISPFASSQNVTGLTINSSTGELTFSSSFSFDGTSLEIVVTATKGSVSATAVMTVSKAMPGADGEAAVSYWLVLDADKVSVDPNTSPHTIVPTTVSATAMKQVGSGAPATATDCTIKYLYDGDSTETPYSGAVTVDDTKSSLTFRMYKGTTPVDSESVPILYEGANGQPGSSAKFVSIEASSLLFSYADTTSSTPNESSITLTAQTENIASPTYQWSYRRAGEQNFQNISGATSSTLVITASTDITTYFASQNVCEFRVTVGTLTDTVSIVRIYGGTSSITAFLTNTSHIFAAGTGSAVAGTDSFSVLAYRGTTATTPTINSVVCIDSPTGISAAVDSQDSTKVNVTVTDQLTTANGRIQVNITVSGVAMSLYYSWALSLTGATGATGAWPRGLNEWMPNTQYYSGATGEEIRDYVFHGENKYRCITTHISRSAFDATEEAFWSQAVDMDFIAAKAMSVDDAFIQNLVVEKLLTKNTENEKAVIQVSENQMSVSNISGNPMIKIHTGVLSPSSSSSSYSLTYQTREVLVYDPSGSRQGTETLTFGSITITAENNRVTTPKFTFSRRHNGTPASGLQEIWARCTLKYGNIIVGSCVLTIQGGWNNREVSARQITMPVGTYSITAEIEYKFQSSNSGTQEYFSGTADSTTGTVSYTEEIAEMATDGFRFRFGTEGFKATSSGAKVIQSGTEYAAVAGDGITRIWRGTQQQYNALGTYSDNVMYVVKG